MPREELIQTCDFVVGDLGEDPCEPGLGIDTVELGGLNEGIGDSRGLTAVLSQILAIVGLMAFVGHSYPAIAANCLNGH